MIRGHKKYPQKLVMITGSDYKNEQRHLTDTLDVLHMRKKSSHQL